MSGQETGMRVLVVHSRYRSAMPSGENRVVDQESEALARAGHEVGRFEKKSDEIDTGPPRRRRCCPPGWSGAAIPPRAGRDAARIPPRRRPRAQHVPADQRGCAVRLPGRVGAGGSHHPQLPADVRQWQLRPPRRGLSRLHGQAAASGRLCTGVTGDRGPPPPRWSWPPSRTAKRGGRWSRPTCSSRRLSGTCTWPRPAVQPGVCPAQHDSLPGHPADAVRSGGGYVGRLEEGKGLRLLMAAWDRYLGSSHDPGLRLVIAGPARSTAR